MAIRKSSLAPILVEHVQQRIFFIRGQRVILSPDLAQLYGVPARVLNQAVQRNKDRFPADFMFQLTPRELQILKSQIVTSSWGGARRARPYAFTEQGVAMLSAVLRGPTAVKISIAIVRAFVRLRQLLATHDDLRQKLESLERKLGRHDAQFTLVFDAIRQLMTEPEEKPRPPAGFQTELQLPKASARHRAVLTGQRKRSAMALQR